MRVLVTGGAGFIGSWTAEELVRGGHKVIVLDNMSSGSEANLSRVAGEVIVVRGDVRERHLIESVVRDHSPDALIHLAAVVSVDEVAEDPVKGFENNVLGTLNVLEAARELGVGKVVYASSAAVYGDPVRLPISEDHPLRPLSVYGGTKLAGEALATSYAGNYGMEVVVLRYFNVYGPRMRPGPYSGVVRKFIEAVLAGEPVTIFGDGEQTRDFVYVEDVARANAAALKPGVSGVYNIGTGEPVSVAGLARAVMEVAGVEVPVKYGPPRPGDIRHSYADIRRARDGLGWEPRTGLAEGLRKTIEFMMQTQ